MMFRKNLIIALRNLINQKKFTFINILGLAIGLASFILIAIWVQDELSYDNFHEDAENTFVVFRNDNGKLLAPSSKLLAPTIKEELPEVLEATCFLQLPESFNSVINYKEKSFVESFALADKHFFNVFSFPLLKGDPDAVFVSATSVLITERTSKKYFGEEDAIGKSLGITVMGQKKLLQVTGVLEDIPHNSHIQTEIILPLEFMKNFGTNWDVWYNQAPTTYIKGRDGISTDVLEEKILACKESHFPEENVNYKVLPITKIHLNATNVEYFTTTGDIKYVYIFSAIAAIILLIACMNYMNLSNALSLKRSKEIGIKKALGSKRLQVVYQYFGETFSMVIIATVFALILVQFSLPVLNYISNKTLAVSFFSPQFILTVLAIIVCTGIISGIYPALFVSGFKPIYVLKGKFVSSPQSTTIRKGLVVFQFVLSIIIIIGTITISNQLRFIKNTNLGYNKEHIIGVALRGEVNNNLEAFKNELLNNGKILNVCRSGNMEAHAMGRTEGIDWPGKQNKFQTWVLHVDEDFASTYGIEMKEGRFYSRDFSTDPTSTYVVNQAAVKEMGFENPIGKELNVWGRQGTIIGVSKDFHFSSLHNPIEPLLFRMPDPEQLNSLCTALSIRIRPNSLPESLEYIEQTWKSYFPNENFDYHFVDQKLEASYLSEARMGTLFKYFSFLVILIACLGLYGLTAFTIEQKSKEIGVHKVLGATIPDVILLFSKGYVTWIIVASLIASPIAYYAMNKWLENFAYKTNLSWWIFALAGVLALGIALLTVSWQSWRAATRNPVEALRYE